PECVGVYDSLPWRHAPPVPHGKLAVDPKAGERHAAGRVAGYASVFEPSFNLVQLAEAAGASYVARWTTCHVKQLSRSTSRFSLGSGFSALSTLRRGSAGNTPDLCGGGGA